MKKVIMLALCGGVLAVAGCAENTPNQNAAIGGVTGAAVGLAAADLAGGNDNAKIAATGLGALAGAAVGHTQGTRMCLYSDGTRRPCYN